MSGKIKNEWELTDEEIARATSLLNARFAEERKQNTLDRGMFGTQSDVNRRAYEAASMSYDDFLQGDTYEDLAKRYSDKGKMAMDDTIGKVAARTGGIASSYATQAGNQAYGDWMTRLEETARAMYDSERQEAMDRYALSKGVLDMRNSAEDRRLALEDRLRAQKYEDEDRQNTIRSDELTALYSELYYNPNAYPTYGDYMNAFPDSLITEAEFNQTKGTATGKYANDNKDTEDEKTEATKEQTWLDAEVIWSTGGTITDEMRQILGLSPKTEAAYAMYYAPEEPKEEEPNILDFNADEIVEQIQGGNVNKNTLSTYKAKYGESYGTKLLREGSYLSMSKEDMKSMVDLLGELGDEKIGDEIANNWYAYHGGFEYKDDKGNTVTTTAKPMKERNYTVVDNQNGGTNGFGGINRDAVVKDDAGNKYTLNADFIELLANNSFNGDKAAARKWIRDNQEKWGVNLNWFKS